jgi:hypothetical protein
MIIGFFQAGPNLIKLSHQFFEFIVSRVHDQAVEATFRQSDFSCKPRQLGDDGWFLSQQ